MRFDRKVAVLGLIFAMFSGSAAALSLDHGLASQRSTADSGEASLQATPTLDLAIATELRDRRIGALVVDNALSMVGTSYKFGVDSDQAMDCSALVRRAFRVAGLEMPRSTKEQIRLGVPVSSGKLRKGDLLFYRWQSSMHVAMYMDEDHILHASPKEGRVVVTRLSSSWDNRLIAARRMI